jgi:hypothetical protein
MRRLASALNCDPAELFEYSSQQTKAAATLLGGGRVRSHPDLRQSGVGRPRQVLWRGGDEIYRFPFPRQWLRRVTNAPPGQLAVIEADGDSMEPTIRVGDPMLVDKTQTNPRRDGIYVICWDGWINVKRVTTDPARRVITVGSDNPAYPANEAVKPGDLVVLGQVIWIGRRI